ncbi:MAG: hypothetical protein U0572_15485 [Phycisphaerales bacterium]
MADTTYPTTAPAPAAPNGTTAWTAARRLALRFAFSYFTLYNLSAVLGIVVSFVISVASVVALPFAPTYDAQVKELGELIAAPLEACAQFWQWAIPWVGKHVLRLPNDITIFPNGSGDTTYNYVELLVFASVAIVVTALCSALAAFVAPSDRRSRRLHDLLRIELRYVLAFTMLGYGFAKVFKTQFPFPSVDQLLTPYGESSPMGLLWRFMGYSTAYTVFTGVAECLGGVLLFWRRTTTLGALVVAGVMVNVVMLNFCYDVPVKLYSSHLLAMALVLVLPESGRLLRVFVLNRPVEPADLRPFPGPRWWSVLRFTAKHAVVFVMLATVAYGGYTNWARYGDDAPRPALFGLYEVQGFSRNGEDAPPLLTDARRWRRVVVDRYGGISFHAMDGARERFEVSVDESKHTLTLTPSNRGAPASGAAADAGKDEPIVFAYGKPADDQLVLEGTLHGERLDVKLKRVEPSTLLLVNRGFRWVNEYPFNR